jgi:ATP-binding cassette subfamily B protein
MEHKPVQTTMIRTRNIFKKLGILKGFPFIAQHDTMDCGPSCLAMISHYYGKKYAIQELRDYCHLSRDGVSLLGIEDGANEIGFETIAVSLTVQDLIDKKPLPCILHWDNSHFVVLYKIEKSILSGEYLFYLMDPSHGKICLTQGKFENYWVRDAKGLALLMNPTQQFFDREVRFANKIGLSFIFNFIRPHKKELAILLLGLTFMSVFTLIFPFLTQALIDVGVNAKNLSFVFIILLAQIFLFLGSIVIEIVRNWVLVFINSKINITIISDFLSKIIKLPFKFFDSKQLGDFSARIGDHQRIEEFLTSKSLIVIFSSLNFIVYFFVLTLYDSKILIVYVSLTVVSILWSTYFLRKLEKIDYQRFRFQSESQQAVYELINGIIEVKLNSIEDYKVSKWKSKQVKLFNISLDTLKFDQMQHVGFDFFNQLKNILVIYIASRGVILGDITLGTLLSISYIIGMMNTPLNQLIDFLRSWQYAKLSFERLNEVQNMANEDDPGKLLLSHDLEGHRNGHANVNDIVIENLNFHYYGPRSPRVLDNLSFKILDGKTTAIVGESGSGKTTLMKLLLKFYEPSAGTIAFGNTEIKSLSAKDLRYNCGVVMQDGYIFSDTLERNIATGDEEVDLKKLQMAIKIANLQEFVASSPQKLKTMLGSGGNGISGGQKQRILIARAVYKNPHYIFFDEATSSLDADNERIIYDNLETFFMGKTVLKIAHRLSTVKNADQIVVMKKGKIVEIGTHDELVYNQSTYFNLVKNQLELSV